MPRPRQLTHGTDVRDRVGHLPKSCYRRRARWKPAGRRRDAWGCIRSAPRNPLGDGTRVLSKKRRHDGPQQVKLCVTKLSEARAGAILSAYAWRWGVALVIQHVGQMQTTKTAARVARAVAWPVCAYLLLVRLYGRDAAATKLWSLCQLTPRFTADMRQEQVHRTEKKWGRTLNQYKHVA